MPERQLVVGKPRWLERFLTRRRVLGGMGRSLAAAGIIIACGGSKPPKTRQELTSTEVEKNEFNKRHLTESNRILGENIHTEIDFQWQEFFEWQKRSSDTALREHMDLQGSYRDSRHPKPEEMIAGDYGITWPAQKTNRDALHPNIKIIWARSQTFTRDYFDSFFRLDGTLNYIRASDPLVHWVNSGKERGYPPLAPGGMKDLGDKVVKTALLQEVRWEEFARAEKDFFGGNGFAIGVEKKAFVNGKLKAQAIVYDNGQVRITVF